MKLKTLTTTALLAVTLFATQAEAERRWPNWYAGLHGSMVFINGHSVRGNPLADDIEQDNGFGYGASLGYRPAVDGGYWRNLRAELEWHQQNADIDKIKNPAGASLNGVGDIRVDSVMFNLFFDATFRDDGLRQALTPYFGGGVGWAQVQLDDTATTLGNSASKDDVLAMQLMAGVSYAPEFLPHTEWTLGYRYFTTADAEFAYTGGGTFKTEYDSHNLEAGVRFLF